jgi:metallophosphoesterase (TIGR00282 family)
MPVNVLFVGDIVGEVGLQFATDTIPQLRETLSADFVIANGENIYEGKGIRPADAQALFDAEVDVITSGNHVWERWQSKKVLESNTNVLRPVNYPPGNAGNGVVTVTDSQGQSLTVVNAQGRTFMADIDCPFRALDDILDEVKGRDPVIVDFHAEATAEKIAMGWYLNGRVAAVLGTHTHAPTADAQVLPGGTAYITDVGMTGPYKSVIGMKIRPAIDRFVYKTPFQYRVAERDLRLAGALVSIDRETGLARGIDQILHPPFPRTV